MPRSILLAAIPLLLLPSILWAQAQNNPPHIGYIYPAGGRQGTEFQVTIGGQYLDGVHEVHISGSGVKATLVEHVKPVTQGQAAALRDKLKDLMDKRGAAMRNKDAPRFTAEDEKVLDEVRKKLATYVRKPASPAIAETATLKFTIAPDAQPGTRELRLVLPSGMTNPMVFCVGQVPETTERELRNLTSTTTEQAITVPAILNGQIMPGDIDKYRFKATKGQKLVIIASARELIPYLADAVPGWFQATLALYDAKGREVSYNDDFRFSPDPVIYFEVPRDGEYVIEIKDSIYRGREDFIYRISIGEFPFITSVFPLGAKAGAAADVEIKGWNLPASRLTADTRSAGLTSLFARQGQFESNHVPFSVDDLPEVMDREPNNSPSAAQTVKLPIMINGRIDQPGDWDIYAFQGHAGQEIVAEVHARRLNSPLDSVLRLTDASGKLIAFNDDADDKGDGLNTHHADSRIAMTLPASGTYYLHIGDTQRQGSADHAYRLHIGPPRPDFELRVVPSSIAVRAGGTVPVTVTAVRKDGFNKDIIIGLKGAPAGFQLSGNKIPAGTDSVRLTLTAAAAKNNEPAAFKVEGRAMVMGKEIVRTAVPSEDMMQAFFYRHLVPAQELTVTVSGKSSSKGGNFHVVSPMPVRLPAGGIAKVLVNAPASTFFGKIELELSDAPEGITIRTVNPVRDGLEVVLAADAAKIKPGTKGNLIVNVLIHRTGGTDKPGQMKRKFPFGTLPAVPFEITSR